MAALGVEHEEWLVLGAIHRPESSISSFLLSSRISVSYFSPSRRMVLATPIITDAELDPEVMVAPDILAACKRGLAHLVYKGKHLRLAATRGQRPRLSYTLCYLAAR
jgi:hypothetical protein